MDALLIALGLTAAFDLLLALCGVLADHLLPHIRFIEKWLDELPLSQK